MSVQGLIRQTLESASVGEAVTIRRKTGASVRAKGLVAYESLDLDGPLGTQQQPRPQWTATLPAGSVPDIDTGDVFVRDASGQEFTIIRIEDEINTLSLVLGEPRNG